MISPNRPNPASSSHSNWDAGAMMRLWDSLQALPASARALAVAAPWLGSGQSLGAVQAAALTGFALSFGDRITCHDRCPDCDTALGVQLSAQALIAAQEAAPEVAGTLSHDGWTVRYHLPTQTDLARLDRASGPERMRRDLLRVTVDHVTGDTRTHPPESLPPGVVLALAERMEQEDPLAAAEMALDCPECGASWQSGFDACAVLLARLEAWARRTLWEVHQLAMRYGWSEARLLEMAPVRREAYLLMDVP